MLCARGALRPGPSVVSALQPLSPALQPLDLARIRVQHAAVVAAAAHPAAQPGGLLSLERAALEAAQPVAQGEIEARHAVIERGKLRTLADQDLVGLVGQAAIEARRLGTHWHQQGERSAQKKAGTQTGHGCSSRHYA